MHRLAKVAEKVQDKIFIIPRVYTNKPRTTGIGYKGMLHQPDPEGKEDLLGGIIAIREMHARVVRETGFTCAEEMLYPENHRYLSDLLSYVAIGARSVEDQQHRLVASGIGIPVGMKNPTGGDISVMMNSIIAAQSTQRFLYRGWEVETPGNPLAHAIMRGYVDKFGRNIPNYHYEDLRALLDAYAAKPEIVNPACIVDTNHSNSGKKYLEQIRIAKDVLHSRRASDDIRKLDRDDGLTSEVIIRIVRDEKHDVYWLVTSNSIQFIKDGQIKQVRSFPFNNNYDIYDIICRRGIK